MRILIAEGSGFLGQVLYMYFTEQNHQVVCLTRTPLKDSDMYWDGEHYGEWIHELNRSDILINLAGKSVNCRYNETNKRIIYDSRIKSTKILGQAIKLSKTPPKLWINASTATIYSHSEKQPNTEINGHIGDDFSMNIAKSWEKTAKEFQFNGLTRLVLLRTSIVLGKNGEAYDTLKTLVKFGLGGKQGKGNQMVSWIHELDFARGVDFVIHNKELEGPVNLTSPNPIQNRYFMEAFRDTQNKLFGLPQPTCLLHLGARILGTEAELLLKSRYVIPEKLLKSEFEFKYPTIKTALESLS